MIFKIDKSIFNKAVTSHRTPNRRKLTFQTSYLARLNYVMQNPVKLKLVEKAKDYKWCSAHWFEKNASKAFKDTVLNFAIDKVQVVDDF